MGEKFSKCASLVLGISRVTVLVPGKFKLEKSTSKVLRKSLLGKIGSWMKFEKMAGSTLQKFRK